MADTKNHRTKITAFQLAMITVAYVASVRAFPTLAEYGATCIFFYLIGALLFLVPSALISAELATAWPGRGGIYLWVKNTLGGGWGFLAIWLQFLACIVSMPAFMSFVGAAAAYVFMPELAGNKYFLIIFMLIIFWASTFISFFGMKTAAWVNSFGAIFGTLIPAAVIIFLGAYWLLSGRPSQVSLSLHSFFPNFHNMHFRDLVFLAGVLFSLTGMEVSGAHAADVKNVRVNFPKGVFLAVILVTVVGFGGLSVAIVVPQTQLSLVAGVLQALQVFFTRLHMPWAIPVLASSITIGMTACINSSVIGPSKGLFGAATEGEIPPLLSKVNSYGMPANLFVVQGIIVTIITMLFLFMPSVSSSYWVIMAVVTILYLGMYMLLFITGIVSRYKHPEIERTYKVPFGNVGIWVLASLGLLSTVAITIISFFPPAQLPVGNVVVYELLLFGGIAIFAGIGVLIYRLREPHWVREIE